METKTRTARYHGSLAEHHGPGYEVSHTPSGETVLHHPETGVVLQTANPSSYSIEAAR